MEASSTPSRCDAQGELVGKGSANLLRNESCCPVWKRREPCVTPRLCPPPHMCEAAERFLLPLSSSTPKWPPSFLTGTLRGSSSTRRGHNRLFWTGCCMWAPVLTRTQMICRGGAFPPLPPHGLIRNGNYSQRWGYFYNSHIKIPYLWLSGVKLCC